MMVSTKGRYALRVMVELAGHNLEEFVPLKEIAEHQEISEKYLEAIMKSLVKEGLVSGLRGKGGGYRLSKHPARYTVGSILKVTEGSLAPVACLEENAKPCPRAEKCVTYPMWKKLNRLIDDFFEGVTLEDLASESQELSGDTYVI